MQETILKEVDGSMSSEMTVFLTQNVLKLLTLKVTSSDNDETLDVLHSCIYSCNLSRIKKLYNDCK